MDISDPSSVIGGLAVFGLVAVMAWRLVVWIRDTPVRPDPWDKENSPPPEPADKVVDISVQCNPEPTPPPANIQIR